MRTWKPTAVGAGEHTNGVAGTQVGRAPLRTALSASAVLSHGDPSYRSVRSVNGASAVSGHHSGTGDGDVGSGNLDTGSVDIERSSHAGSNHLQRAGGISPPRVTSACPTSQSRRLRLTGARDRGRRPGAAVAVVAAAPRSPHLPADMSHSEGANGIVNKVPCSAAWDAAPLSSVLLSTLTTSPPASLIDVHARLRGSIVSPQPRPSQLALSGRSSSTVGRGPGYVSLSSTARAQTGGQSSSVDLSLETGSESACTAVSGTVAATPKKWQDSSSTSRLEPTGVERLGNHYSPGAQALYLDLDLGCIARRVRRGGADADSGDQRAECGLLVNDRTGPGQQDDGFSGNHGAMSTAATACERSISASATTAVDGRAERQSPVTAAASDEIRADIAAVPLMSQEQSERRSTTARAATRQRATTAPPALGDELGMDQGGLLGQESSLIGLEQRSGEGGDGCGPDKGIDCLARSQKGATRLIDEIFTVRCHDSRNNQMAWSDDGRERENAEMDEDKKQPGKQMEEEIRPPSSTREEPSLPSLTSSIAPGSCRQTPLSDEQRQAQPQQPQGRSNGAKATWRRVVRAVVGATPPFSSLRNISVFRSDRNAAATVGDVGGDRPPLRAACVGVVPQLRNERSRSAAAAATAAAVGRASSNVDRGRRRSRDELGDGLTRHLIVGFRRYQ